MKTIPHILKDIIKPNPYGLDTYTIGYVDKITRTRMTIKKKTFRI